MGHLLGQFASFHFCYRLLTCHGLFRLSSPLEFARDPGVLPTPKPVGRRLVRPLVVLCPSSRETSWCARVGGGQGLGPAVRPTRKEGCAKSIDRTSLKDRYEQ